MDFGEKIKFFRKEKKLTQTDLAKTLNITQQTVAQYERARKVPKLDTVKKIANALNISYLELLDEEMLFEADIVADVSNEKQKQVIKNLQERNIYLIAQRIRNLGDEFKFHIIGQGSVLFFKDYAVFISDEELISLEKEIDNYLKYKLIELIQAKITKDK